MDGCRCVIMDGTTMIEESNYYVYIVETYQVVYLAQAETPEKAKEKITDGAIEPYSQKLYKRENSSKWVVEVVDKEEVEP